MADESLQSNRRLEILLVGALVVSIVVVAAYFTLEFSGVLDRDVWTREHPLTSPIAVVSVKDGVVTLSDGRSFAPAGVERAQIITPAKYDEALAAATDQGVEVLLDLGNGRAVLMCEPRFRNTCGTRGYKGDRHAWWAGGTYGCRLSELLICSGYAIITTDKSELPPREQWHLEATVATFPSPPQSGWEFRRLTKGRAFSFTPEILYLGDEQMYTAVYKEPPS
ncbi:MAG: hypothetical protein IT432_06010 [Phycisphaerales bacterium]|nr:hypothetical protein [Phycisphaerales bacterium]